MDIDTLWADLGLFPLMTDNLPMIANEVLA